MVDRKYHGLANQGWRAAIIKELHGWVDNPGEPSEKDVLIRDEIFNAMNEWRSDNPSTPNGITAGFIVVQGTLSNIMAAFRNGTVTHLHIDKLDRVLADFFSCANEMGSHTEREQRPMAEKGKKIDEGSRKSSHTAIRKIIERDFLRFNKIRGRFPKADELFNGLTTCDPDQEIDVVIQEIDVVGKKIIWLTKKGKPKTMTYKRFENLLTELKKINK